MSELDVAIHIYPRLKEIIIVNDGSSDATEQLLKNYSRSWLRIIHLKKNMKKGGAIAIGMAKVSYKYCFFTDADLPYDLKALDIGIRALDQGAQIVAGSRHHTNSTSEINNPQARSLSSRVFSRLVNMVLDQPVADTQCGFKGFTRATAQKLFAEQKITGFCFDVELFARAQQHGMKITLIPVHWKNNDETTVSLLRDSIRMMSDLVRLHIHLRVSTQETGESSHTVPMIVGAMVALLCIPIAFTLGILPWISFPLLLLLGTLWVVGMALCAYAGYTIVQLLPIRRTIAHELARYILIGVFNTILNVAVVDSLIIATGITTGVFITLFSTIAYTITLMQSFFWNRYWIFRTKPIHREHHAFAIFASIIISSTLISIGFIHIMVNVIGAPAFISQIVWANIAIASTIPISFITNFLGTKILVFGSQLRRN